MTVQLLNGLAFGVLLLILASGLAMIFGLRGIINFAHGALYMFAAYIGLTITQHTSFWVALIVTPIGLGILGIVLDRYGIRYLSGRGYLDFILLTFGLTFVLTGIVQTGWGTQPRAISPPAILNGSTDVLGSSYPIYRLFVIIVGLAVAGALLLWLQRSRIGLHIRASSTHREVATVVGIDVNRVSAMVVGIGAGLAGLAGVLAGPYLSLSPNMGAEILILTFIVVVVGGLGSMGGAMIAAVALGLMNSFASVHLPEFAPYVPYALMIVVLLIRPTGIAGTRTA